MKKLLSLFLLISLILISCEKIDSSLIGSWRLNETNYLITANQDFTFTNVFGSPWKGTIKIDNKNLNPMLFNYYFENVWGQTLFASENVSFTFAGPNRLEIYYENALYLLEKEYIFNISTGLFKVDGTAKYQDRTLQIAIELTMPKVELKKGAQFLVKDGYNFMPYRHLWLNNGGKLQTDYLTGDIMDRLSGKWNISDNKININLKNRASDIYQYRFNNDKLLLSKEKNTKEQLPHHISPFADKISNTTYQALYTRE
ncbi:MAG TPA: hypothetical protein DDW74_07070 [Porphyromonadaceae bacterium]|jgi:hypothetical protein|nr:hypothetical protein [Proteiniphilum sp. UBA4988]HBG80469.1 hypothetical protein [Porphyromonadaceae bacterium]